MDYAFARVSIHFTHHTHTQPRTICRDHAYSMRVDWYVTLALV